MGDAMKTYTAFLRAVNVGGTGKLPMQDLREMCNDIGFKDTQTYIASGNIVFGSEKSAKDVKTDLEAALFDYANKDVGVIVRTAPELKKVLDNNPFPNEKPNFTVAILLDKKPAKNTIETATGLNDEIIVLGNKEIYVHYGSGMGSSKLKMAAQKIGTARNLNTIKKMVALSSISQP